MGGGGGNPLPWNNNYTYKINDVCVHNGELWHASKENINIEPGTNYNYWNVTYSNKNLLDNWDFTNVVNQRGTTLNHNTGYWLDRWVCGNNNPSSAKYTINSNGVTLSRNSGDITTNVHMIQRLESPSVEGQTLTASVIMGDGSIYAGTATLVKSFDNSFFFSISNTLNVFYQLYDKDGIKNSGFQFVINNICEISGVKDSFTVKAVKLEFGKVSTIANDILGISYKEELYKCQRYYCRVNKMRVKGDITANSMIIHPIQFPVPMRIAPSSGLNKLLSGLSGINVSIGNVQSNQFCDLIVESTLSYNASYDCGFEYIDFSADL